ncbi:MAG: ABC transporter ATP-binding protein [Pedosphaera sp.]|nr:ABC transporter ATP-binding protein [Pedosphaera sp.]
MATIRVHNLTRVFHVGDSEVRAVNGLTLALETGALASIIGPSGSGKSTLLALLGGLDTPTAGTITVDDRPLHSLNADELAAYRRTSVGFIFQDFFLLSHLTALENVETPLKLAGMPRAQRRDRARALIEQVGLAARADHHPRQLSGGERQRVAIARALANHPRLLLADEPTGNLDVHTGRQIADLLVQLNAEQGITMLMVTHNMEVARRTPLQLRMTDGRLDPIAA